MFRNPIHYCVTGFKKYSELILYFGGPKFGSKRLLVELPLPQLSPTLEHPYYCNAGSAKILASRTVTSASKISRLRAILLLIVGFLTSMTPFTTLKTSHFRRYWLRLLYTLVIETMYGVVIFLLNMHICCIIVYGHTFLHPFFFCCFYHNNRNYPPPIFLLYYILTTVQSLQKHLS